MSVPDQTELFKAETSWFHVFKTMVDSGDVARMGPHAFTVYAVIKSHTNFSTGRAFPAMETIVEKSGVSKSQVIRALKTLVDFDYVTVEKRGRSNRYTLREKVEIKSSDGRPTAVATWDYLPTGVSEAVAELKRVLVTGDSAGTSTIKIEHLTLNIATNGGTLVNGALINAAGLSKEERLEVVEQVMKGTGKTVGKSKR